MSGTISGFHNTGQVLPAGVPDITISGTIDGDSLFTEGALAGYVAVAGPAGTVFTITNSALIEAPDDHGNATLVPAGIALISPGTVINSGSIEGAGTGIFMTGSLIDGQAAYIQNLSVIAGTLLQGIYLGTGGVVNNFGTISGFENGVFVAGTAGIVINSKLIEATGSTFVLNGQTEFSSGVLLSKGGTVINEADARLTGGIGVAITGSTPGVPNSIDNVGTITGTYIGALSTALSGITNAGVIEGTIDHYITFGGGGFAGIGVDMTGGGTVSNLAGGTIAGADFGVLLATSGGGATVDNSGLIEGVGARFVDAGGTYGSAGVFTASGGTVINRAGGIIIGNVAGVQNRGNAAAFVDNFGVIESTSTNFYGNTANLSHGGGVVLNTGGTLINEISGHVSGYFGAYVGSGSLSTASYLDNFGVIDGTNADGVLLGRDASLSNSGHIAGPDIGLLLVADNAATNQASGVITGGFFGVYAANALGLAPTLDNLGTISAGDIGVLFDDSGHISNASGGFITGGFDGVQATSSSSISVVIDNVGTITGTDTSILFNGVTYAADGTYLFDGGTVDNTGTISGIGWGDYFSDSGFVSNSSTGKIIGFYDGVGQSLASGSLTLENAGLINATDDVNFTFMGTVEISAGVVAATGLVDNAASGTIAGSIGDLFNDGGTLINAGTIIGRQGYAAYFQGANNLLVVDPGAVFNGTVAVAAGSSGMMQLAASAADGTIAGIGSAFTGFSAITVDAGADWVLAGANTLAVGQTLSDLGTLTVQGAFTNDGVVKTDPAVLRFDSTVTGDGTIDIGASSTVEFKGSVATGETLDFLGVGTLRLDMPGSFEAAIEALAPGDKLELAGTAVSSVNFGAHSLTIATSAGVYEFSNVSFAGAVGAYSATFDAATGLEDVTLRASAAPVITAPAAKSITAGTASAITGVSIADSAATAGEVFTVQLNDSFGRLGATGSGVSGANTGNLTLTGSLGQVNAELATLTDTDLTAGNDRISIDASDNLGGHAPTAAIMVTAGGSIGGGGFVDVSAGQTATGLALGGGGIELLTAGANANATTLNAGGVQVVAPGGNANGTTINNGGGQLVLGRATGTVVENGGYEFVGSGGVSVGTEIGQGGVEYVYPGGAAANTTIGSGGVLILTDGAQATGSIDFAGNGAVNIGGTTLPIATVYGFDLGGASSDEIVLTSFNYVPGHDSVQLGAGNVLTLNLNGAVKKLYLDSTANYAGHAFSLTRNSLGDVVVVDPLTGAAAAKMDFLAPVTTVTASSAGGGVAGLFGAAPGPLPAIPGAASGALVSIHALGASFGAAEIFAQQGAGPPLIPLLTHIG